MSRLRPSRRTLRLKGFDYAQPGAYYITLCTLDRACTLGSVTKGLVELSPFGEIVERVWQDLPRRFEHLYLDEHVVMPNHLHGIFFMGAPPEPERDGADTVFTYPAPQRAQEDLVRGTVPGSMSAVIQNLSSTTTRRINRLRGTPGKRFWQERGFEHVVRGERELRRLREYIRSNPERWDADPENPERTQSPDLPPFDREAIATSIRR
ncbi:MAG: transposase [Thermoanaerobaculia bacterium]